MTARIGVLALQGDFREHLRMLTQCGADGVKVRSEADLSAVDGLIIPGGESTTIGMLIVRNGLEAPLRAAIGAGLPVMGTCAGMILLASEVLDGRPDQLALGAIDMTVRRNAFGRQVDSFESAVQVPSLPGPPITAVFIRAPWVERVGDRVQILGTVVTEDGTDRIVAVRQGNALATSFHPEVTDDVRFHALLVDMVQEAS
ncbi:MAG: pyridoxal 5'-phosphate synthase glutaminase subunit PdxT [Actinobacteria bacterium]|nr:pyridoxal 5'-phosphate synthase glutaminase subunit PdxT [Actinomycetota bacterium]MCB8995894.1 pyridoxal 5'-phosphate synthase glutaminase subunit PdxT [Actinomycetota bacterium]MCB9415146.1 pyridoxal 5'-phosphate synthase glutaminase subunit PdxT [Actinomycetota bacterium]MCB9424611.1 pyridoxal 5'-phosphate synthase glutaminase subunit PdxT [Actinomycetota bacterium]HRY08501.1 pyridoxal 5'-phosphate synthase glutaminase subunit PdxT [Candidatus Nanopelagicales bacterium]